ncbi:uncharacterized protein LOC131886573 [Tigriopus californicus]|uniref:uncharacterized protein LOC131886573 n=1 Tax=Tigriopus californicus TaxID=6832 RepID=UPI0027DA1B94|nr:uncharacterized protein LOC131886573 [Tigriopus californicus]
MGCAASSQDAYSNGSYGSGSEISLHNKKRPEEVVYSDIENQALPVLTFNEQISVVSQSGSGSSSHRDRLDEFKRKGRDEIRQAQEKLNASLNTPIVDKEIRVLESGAWLEEHKDLTHRRSVLPPIQNGKQITSKGMAFNVD